MPSYAIAPPSTNRVDPQQVWLVLTLAASWPVWMLARAVPGFLSVDAPAAADRAPTLWSIVRSLPWIGDLPLGGLAMASAIGAGAWLAAVFVSKPPREKELLRAALLVALTIPALLLIAQFVDFIPAIVFAMAGDRRIAALVVGGTLLALVGAAPLGALAIVAAVVLIGRPFLASPANDNGLPIYAAGSFETDDAC